MNIPKNWDSTQAYDGNSESITPGGHICKIVNAKVESPYGSEQLVLALEIAEGSRFDGMYRKIFESRKQNSMNGNEVRWPCVFRQFTLTRDGDASPYFKGLIKCVEESNTGYRWNWLESTLAGKMIGVIFREEEFVANDGSIKTTVRPAFIRNVQRIKDGVEVPEIKRLNTNGNTNAAAASSGFTQVDDSELPF